MSAQQSWALQQAVYARLTAQLSVTVFDYVPENPDRTHCRIDGFFVAQRLVKSDKTRHIFNVHIFDRPTTGSTAGRGQKTAKQLQQSVIAALHDWKPSVTGAAQIRHEESSIEPDEDGLTQHAVSRFSIYIG